MIWIVPQRDLMGGAVAASLLGASIFCIAEPVQDRRPLILMQQIHRHGGAEAGSIDGRQRMQRTSLALLGENTIEASVTIRRAVAEVFGFYRDFTNLPSFLGDVMAIEQIGPAFPMDNTRPPGHSSQLDDKSD